MKQSADNRRVVLAMLMTLATACAEAVTVIWDADSGTSGAQDGSGNWNAADTNWWSGSSGVLWSDGADAVFGNTNGTAGTVTLNAGNVKPNSLTFNAAGSGTYTLASGGTNALDFNGVARTVTVNASDAAVSGIITNGGLTKFGNGSLTLAGRATVSSLQINGGSVAVSSNLTVSGTGGSSVFYLGNGNTAYSGTLTVNTGATVMVTGSFADAAVIGRDGGSGTVVQNGGLFQFGMSGQSFNIGASSSGSTAALYAMNGGTLDLVNHTLNVSFYGAGAFTGTLSQTGGVITNVNALSLGNATAMGNFTLGGGSLFVGAGGVVGTAGKCKINLGGGTVGATAGWTSSLNMNLTNLSGSVMFDTEGNAVTLSGVLSGNGGLNKRGAGALTLNNTNSYSGGTAVYTGDVAIANASALGVGSVTVANSARLLMSGNINVPNTLMLGSEAPAYNNQLLSTGGSNIWSGPITVNGSSIAASGGSTLRITNGIAGPSYVSFASSGLTILETRPIALTNQTVYFGGGSAGAIRLNVGNNVFSTANFWGGVTLFLGLADALPTNAAITANNPAGGRLDLNGFNQTVGKLDQNSTYLVTVTNSGASATFTVNQSANTAFAGQIGGSLALVKTGAGTLTLSNTNTFTGGAVISNGTLKLAVGSALPSAGPVAVAGGTYDLGGFTVTNGAVTLSGGEVANGALQAAALTLTGGCSIKAAISGSGGLTKSGPGTALVQNTLGYAGPTVVSGGTLKLQPLPSGTVAYYGFNDSSNLGKDGSPQSNTLKTVTGTPQYSSGGKFGGALYLDGSSTLGTVSGLFPTGVPTGAAPYTVSAFIKTDAGCPVQGGWIGYGNAATSQANNFRLNGTYTNVWNYWWANDFGANIPGGSFTDGWHSVVGTWDGTTEIIYIDGVNKASRNPTGLNIGTNNFVVGRTIGDANFKGWVDDLLIANRALTASEIASLNTFDFRDCKLPTGTSVQVANGAVLDLNGNSQSVASLSGSGTVTGGTLTVTGRLTPGDTNTVISALTVHSGLVLAAGVTNAFDCTSTASDVVNVAGTLTLQGAGTVQVSLSDAHHPPQLVTLFTFSTLAGGGNLAGWNVVGTSGGYTAKLIARANDIVLTISPVGTLITVK